MNSKEEPMTERDSGIAFPAMATPRFIGSDISNSANNIKPEENVMTRTHSIIEIPFLGRMELTFENNVPDRV
jgi:hypothetical protein